LTCLLVSDSVGPAGDVSAAFDDSAEAGRARRAGAVEPPVRLDCEGRPIPALAVAWSRDTTGRFWTLGLRPSVADSLHWTAGSLAATWRADPDAQATLGWAGIESLVPLDERRLVVAFATPQLDLPPVFADLSLGVGVGSRPSLVPVPPGADLRDAVDQGPDVIVAGDPDVLDYARRRPGLTLRPLPWSRGYLLVMPRVASADLGIASDTAAFQSELARDAVRTEARAPELPAWWESRAECSASRSITGRPNHSIVYSTADPIARGLAERLVALSGGAQVTARGLPPESLSVALRSGGAEGFVIGVPARAAVPCRETAGWPDSAVVVRLVEVRAQVVLRRGAPALVSDWDGTLRLLRP
jgi:hypothetical protein